MAAYLTILRGVPGSGKTTAARRMVRDDEADAYFEADMWMLDETGHYVYDRTMLASAHQACFERVESALLKGQRVVVSNTFTRVWEFQPYLDLAARLGCGVTVRCKTGAYPNVHGVPEDKVNEMRARMEPWP